MHNIDFSLEDYVIFNKKFIDIGLTIKESIFLSTAIHWSNENSESDGFFYKTSKEWTNKTCLNNGECKIIKTNLLALGLLSVKSEGSNKRILNNTLKVNKDIIISSLMNNKNIKNSTKVIPVNNQMALNGADSIPSENNECLGKNVNEIMSIFIEINPALKFNNITERKIIKELIIIFGFQKVSDMAKFAVEANNIPYFPTITKPFELKRDYAKLKSAFIKQSKISGKGQYKIVDSTDFSTVDISSLLHKKNEPG